MEPKQILLPNFWFVYEAELFNLWKIKLPQLPIERQYILVNVYLGGILTWSITAH